MIDVITFLIESQKNIVNQFKRDGLMLI